MSDKTLFVTANVYPGKLNSLVKNLMLQTGVDDPNEAVRLINSGEYITVKRVDDWREEDGVIYFTLTSSGKTRDQFIEILNTKERIAGECTNPVFSKDFTPTNCTYEIAIIKGTPHKDDSFAWESCHYEDVNKRAQNLQFFDANIEIMYLYMEKYSAYSQSLMNLMRVHVMSKFPKTSKLPQERITTSNMPGERYLESIVPEKMHNFDRRDGFLYVVNIK